MLVEANSTSISALDPGRNLGGLADRRGGRLHELGIVPRVLGRDRLRS